MFLQATRPRACACNFTVSRYIAYFLFVVSNFMNFFSILGGYNGDVYLLVKLLLPTAGKKRVYNLQSKQIVKLLSQVIHSAHEMLYIGTAVCTYFPSRYLGGA